MHLTCPSCGATFLVEPKQLGPSGRRVRCGECEHTWRQERPSEAEAAERSEAKAAAKAFAPSAAGPADGAPEPAPAVEPPPAAPAFEPPPAAPAAERPPVPAEERERISRRARSKPPALTRERREMSLTAGWVAFFVVVASLAAVFYFGRAQLVAMAPGMTRLYDLVGLSAKSPELGLELRDYKYVRRLVDGEPVIVIKGMVANVSGSPREVPPLRARLTDAAGEEVTRWTFQAAATTLPPGGTTEFETTASNPPSGGSVEIVFVSQD